MTSIQKIFFEVFKFFPLGLNLRFKKMQSVLHLIVTILIVVIFAIALIFAVLAIAVIFEILTILRSLASLTIAVFWQLQQF